MAIKWIDYDQLDASAKLASDAPADLTKVMTAERVQNYSAKMAAGMAFNYAAKNVDDNILKDLQKLADEAGLIEKFEALYNGEVINTGEKRL
ncbi:MAG: glucose-6-phosphate isomerase, partial [Lachnospiraceae bacterium]|nr:glucose-6-phosphate isomerase [Lachnospiraceae bacterium]